MKNLLTLKQIADLIGENAVISLPDGISAPIEYFIKHKEIGGWHYDKDNDTWSVHVYTTKPGFVFCHENGLAHFVFDDPSKRMVSGDFSLPKRDELVETIVDEFGKALMDSHVYRILCMVKDRYTVLMIEGGYFNNGFDHNSKMDYQDQAVNDVLTLDTLRQVLNEGGDV